MKIHITLLVVLLGCTPLQAAIYKCADAQGETEYSDEPCGGNASVFVPKTAPAPAGDAAARADKTQRLLRAYDIENAEQQRKAVEALAAREEAEQKCTRARDRLRGVTQARAVYRLDDEGNRVVLSFEERAASEEKARAQVEHWCI
jgi:hypothetical protein